MKRLQLEVIEVPLSAANLAEHRTAGMVEHYSGMGKFGTIDLRSLAVSSYLQGVWDGSQAIERLYGREDFGGDTGSLYWRTSPDD